MPSLGRQLTNAENRLKELEAQVAANAKTKEDMAAELKRLQEKKKAMPPTAGTLYAQYSAIEDPVARSRFWNANAEALRQESKTRANK